MRIAVRRNSPQQLDLVMTPVLTPAYRGSAVLFALLGVVAVWFLARSVRLDCTRPAKTCAVTEWHVLRRQSQVVTPSGARVVTNTKGLVASMTLVLETTRGDRRLNLVRANGDAKEALAWDVWHFVQDSTVAQLRYVDDGRPFGWALGLFLLGSAAVCLLAVEKVHIAIDRERGEVRITRRRWLDRGAVTIPLADVRDAEAREYSLGRSSSWGVSLRLEGNREEPLTRFPMFTQSSASHAVGLIGSWLEGRAT